MPESRTTIVDFWDKCWSQQPVQKKTTPELVDAVAFFGDLKGKKLLDLGCGVGASTLYFAAQGATVVGVDISPVSVAKLNDYCHAQGIDNVTAQTCDAFAIDSLGPFDFIFGSMILHHLEPFDKFARVLGRSVHSGGRCFFYENSAVSDLLIWCRRHLVGRFWIPKYGDDEEFPLMPSEIALLRGVFSVMVEVPELWFFRLISMYILRGRLRGPFEWLDRTGYRIKPLRRLSYRQYVKLTRFEAETPRL